MSGDHSTDIAVLKQRYEDIVDRLGRIEDKVDKIVWRVAGGAATTSFLTALVVAMVVGWVNS